MMYYLMDSTTNFSIFQDPTMRDPRLDKLASVLINHSTRLQPGQTILIEVFDIPEEMVLALIQKTREAGGIPLVSLKNNRVQRELIQAGDAENMKQIAEVEAFRMERVQAYIGLRGSRNVTEMSDIPSEAMATYEQHWWNRVHSNIQAAPYFLVSYERVLNVMKENQRGMMILDLSTHEAPLFH